MIEDIITIYSNDRGGSKLSAQFIDKVEAKAGEAISQMQAAADEGREGRGGKSPRYVFPRLLSSSQCKH